MSNDPEPSRIDFEREKWRDEQHMRERELIIREREQANRDAETELKRQEQAGTKWRNPLVVAIFAATVAALGNAGVTWINGVQQRGLEDRKRIGEATLERSKAESTRILEMIKTGDTEKAADNLTFLLEAGLVSEEDLVRRLKDYLANRKPGTGPSLPAQTARFGFEVTEALTSSIQKELESTLNKYIAYIDSIGFPRSPDRVLLRIEKMDTPTAYYHNHTIVIDYRLATDALIALRQYSHFILAKQGRAWIGQFAAIESALASYFVYSYLNNIGLDNEKKFDEFTQIEHSQMPYQGGEIWAGAFWEMRKRLGREIIDPLLASAWASTKWPEKESDTAATFVQTILSEGRAKIRKEQLDGIVEVLKKRAFPGV
jgi:hypothetical protein